MKESYNFGECTVIPDSFIIKNCGEVALENLGRLIDYLKSVGADFYRADQFAGCWKE